MAEWLREKLFTEARRVVDLVIVPLPLPHRRNEGWEMAASMAGDDEGGQRFHDVLL